MDALLFPIEEVVYEHDGEQMCSDELALAQLLIDDVLLPFELKDSQGRKTTALFVNTSDDFAWGCADCEPLPNEEIPNLYRMYAADRGWGALRWACLRRNMQPQAPRKKAMIEAGSWDAVLEALPGNAYDKACRERNPTCSTHAVVG
jgi:hypothetical protein